jgi:hypothetical protein
MYARRTGMVVSESERKNMRAAAIASGVMFGITLVRG